jgi:ribosome-associated translation inhibitor RaiA
MQIQFHSPDAEGARYRARSVQRVRKLMRWLRSFVSKVQVRLEDVNGPEPGVDKRCQMRALLPDGRVARIDATSRQWREAVDLASARLRQQVVQQLHRTIVVERPRAAAAPAPLRSSRVHRLPLPQGTG